MVGRLSLVTEMSFRCVNLHEGGISTKSVNQRLADTSIWKLVWNAA